MQGYGGLTGALAIMWVKHMVKDSSWGTLQSLGGSRDGLLILRGKHNSTGLLLVEEAAAKISSAVGCRSRILGVPCLAGLQLRREG